MDIYSFIYSMLCSTNFSREAFIQRLNATHQGFIRDVKESDELAKQLGLESE